jgi:asparagine synthase (glutamine-hydrolysing)
MFDGISKLAPGATARLDAAGVTVAVPEEAPPRALSVDEGVGLAADALTATMERLLDEHPDVILQLSGGWDSRLLLSAVPPSRRRGLRAMTLGDPDDGDVRIARMLAERCGLDHEVRPAADASRLSPEEAWRRVHRAVLQVDAHTDALAVAALALAEEQFDQGARISGVGGEVGRGFYYSSRVRDRSYDRDDARRLAAWRMFPNHAVEPGMLDSDFARWAHDVAVDEVYAALRRGGDEWFRATDRLYLRNRVQRWAGTNDTAVGDDRLVVNPMLSAPFLAAVEGVAPAEKAHARFFGRLQMRLDPQLGTVPLEGRPSPAAHAAPSGLAAVGQARTLARKGVRKVVQRVRGGNRPAAGTDALAELVVRHWRSHDALVRASPTLGEVVDPAWIDRVLSGACEPRPSSVALATALTVVTDHAG